MNTTTHIYVSERDIQFVQWFQHRFGRGYSKQVIQAMRDYVGDEWTRYAKSKGLIKED